MTNEEIQALVNSMYGSVGRVGIGQAVNQIDQGGYDYWANQLASGALDPNAAQQTFSTAIDQYMVQNPNDPYSQYISSYQKSLPPVPAPASGLAAAAIQPPTATTKSTVSTKNGKVQPVAAPVAAPVVASATQKVAAPATKTTSAPAALSQPATVAPKAPVVAAPASTAPATGGVSDAFILSWLAKNPNPTASQISALRQFGVTPDRIKALSSPAPVAAPAAPVAATPAASKPYQGVTVEDLYRMHAGKEPDAEGLAFWKNAFGPEISEAERAQFIKSVVDVQNKPAAGATPPAAVGTTKPAEQPEIAPGKPTTVESLYQDILGRKPSKAEVDSWGFGADVDAGEIGKFLDSARNEAVTTMPKTGAVGNLAQQILGQGFTNKWSGEGYGSAEKNAYDMAALLAAQGITDINQFGVRDKTVTSEKRYNDQGDLVDGTTSTVPEYYNKVTGEAINSYYDKATGNTWSGTFAGDGSTNYKVQFDASGNPIFYTEFGGSSNDLANTMADLGPAGQIAIAVATGGLSIPQQIAAQAAIGLASGRDPADIAKSALASYAMAGISDVAAIKDGTKYLNSVDSTGALSGAFKGAITSGVKAGLTGQDIGSAVMAGATSGGLSGAVSAALDQPEFKGLTNTEKQIAATAIGGALSGKPLDKVLIDAAISAGRAAIKSATAQSGTKALAPVEDMGPTSYGTNVTKQLTDAGLIDGNGQFADAGSLTDADLAEIVGGTPQYASQVQNIISDALGSVGIAQALPNPSMPGYGAALENAGPALYKVVADAANDPDYLRKLPLLEKALSAAGTSVSKILSGAPLELATYAPELGSNEAELLARARSAGITLDANPAGAGRGLVNPTAPSTLPPPAIKPASAPKPDYVVQPGDYTDTTEEVQPWQLVDPVSGLPLPSEPPEPDIPEPTPDEPLVIPDAPPANDPFINPPTAPDEEPFVAPEAPPANDPLIEPPATPSQEPEHNPRKPVFIPTQPDTWPSPAEDPLFNPYEPVTWPEVNPPPAPSRSPQPAPAPAPNPSTNPAPSPRPAPAPAPGPNPAPKPQPAPAPSPSPSPKPRPTPSPAPAPAPKPSPEPKPEPAPQPKPQPQPQPQPAPEPKPNPKPRPKPIPKPQPPVVTPPVVTPPVVNPPVVIPPVTPPEVKPPEVNPPEVKPPEVKPPVVKPPVVKVPPKVVQQVALQLGVPATSQIAQDIAEALYGTMDYLDISEEFRPSERKARPAATLKQMQQTKMAQGGYLDTMLAENMSVDDLLNLLR